MVSGWGARAVSAASCQGPSGILPPAPSPPAPDPGLPGAGPGGDWLLRDFTELSAWPGAVPQARAHTGQALRRWGIARLAEDAELVVSELVTNAVTATHDDAAGCPVRLWLLSDRARLLVLVWDGCRHSPARIDPGEDEECGRGLLLVETVSREWDWYATLHPAGKAVWALCE